MKTNSLSIDALRQAVSRLPEDRLAPMRQRALEQLGERGLPTVRHEDWKYTDLGPIIDISNRWLEESTSQKAGAALDAAVAEILEAIDADWLIIANGKVDADSLATFSNTGVSVSLLSASDVALESTLPLTQLNTALLQDGLRISVDANAEAQRPIGLLLIDDSTSAAGLSQARVHIEVGENARGAFIEYHASLGDAPHYANAVVDLALAPGAKADYVRVQSRARAHSQTTRLDVRLDRDSNFNHSGFDLGGALIRNDLAISIGGAGAAAAFDGLYLGGSGQHIDNHTRVDHRTGPAESHQEYRGILAGKSRGVWNGKAIVHVGADGTDAEQANHNLLLSDNAEIDAKPELEIYADDVKCSHGTTVGQLDDTALFYLRTRGLSKHEAKQVLTAAFAQTIVSKAHTDAARDYLQHKVAQRLDAIMQSIES